MFKILNKSVYLLLLLILLITTMYSRGLPERKLPEAHNFDLPTIDGRKLNLSDYQGKIVLLNFWATWCAPCIKEMPELEKLHKEYNIKGLQVIGVAIVSKKDDVPKKVDAAGVTYPVCLGEKQLIADYGYFTSIPQTFIIDRNGKIVKEYAGSLEPSEIEKDIRSILFE